MLIDCLACLHLDADALLMIFWPFYRLLGLGTLTLSSMLRIFHPANCGTACPPPRLQVALFYVSLYLVAIAQGGHKPCVQAFGADQFDQNDPQERVARSSFFNWWYFGICCGVVVTLVVLSYVQDNIGWGLGFGIPCIVMLFALVLFVLGTRTYRFCLLQEESPFARIGRTLVALARKRLGKLPITELQSDIERVEETKGLFRLFPIWTTCLIYAVVFAQSSTLFTKQGGTLDRRISSKLQVPPAALQSFISASIIVSIPIYDGILVPVARKFSGLPSGITMLQRIGTGMSLSLVSMVIAALVEMKRLKTAREFGLVDQPNARIPMSLWWLVPQYVLFGVADVFTMVGLQEFFYDQVPDALRSLGLALYMSIFGIGSFISGFLISVINKTTSRGGESWFSSNLNRAHLDYFYWLLAGLSMIELVLYVYFTQAYVIGDHFIHLGTLGGCEGLSALDDDDRIRTVLLFRSHSVLKNTSKNKRALYGGFNEVWLMDGCRRGRLRTWCTNLRARNIFLHGTETLTIH
ncbi:hypothetical protein C4D60_Mb09t00430 [Musa balbisiana]|uniref:Major facilitator superfamily (MFS) profile domain-containing protein n=1 Tax=Musa balbisiana TaxID=52838 RepID=A0A4S8IDS5_MUSBA|nr:hypothetical protein C4D60_Mb09t00430 [Musa balbisiana]